MSEDTIDLHIKRVQTRKKWKSRFKLRNSMRRVLGPARTLRP